RRAVCRGRPLPRCPGASGTWSGSRAEAFGLRNPRWFRRGDSVWKPPVQGRRADFIGGRPGRGVAGLAANGRAGYVGRQRSTPGKVIRQGRLFDRRSGRSVIVAIDTPWITA